VYDAEGNSLPGFPVFAPYTDNALAHANAPVFSQLEKPRGAFLTPAVGDLDRDGVPEIVTIAGVDIPREKRVEIALTYVFGIGLPTSQKILAQTNINPDTRVRDLTEEQVNRLRELIDRRYKVEGDLRREVALNVKRLQEIGAYRGVRHRRGLPVNGQRTKTNARTRKGPKKTVGRGKKAKA